MLKTLLAFTLLTTSALAAPRFDVVVLGSRGGMNEADVSAYLVAPAGEQRFLCMDAGSLYHGVHEALLKGRFGADATEGDVIRKRIKAYLISHSHFDHIAGLVMSSPEDSSKPLIGLRGTIDNLRDCVFQPRVWSNFTDEGPGAIGKYHLRRVEPGKPFEVEGMPFDIEAYPLSHTPDMTSTAFLIKQGDDALVYCGDTGADAVEGKPYLAHLWKRLAPFIRAKRLHGIFLECSFPSARADKSLFGHLTPRWMMAELHDLAREVGDPAALRGLTVAVTHVKPAMEGPDPLALIESELRAQNDLGINFVFPRQADKLEL